MIDLQQIRRTIEAAPEGGRAAVVKRSWLEEVERELADGRAAIAELAALRAGSQQLLHP